VTATAQIDHGVRRRLDALVDALRQAGAIRTSQWAEAFAAVPRHVFLPRLYLQDIDPRGIAAWRPLDAADRSRWLDAVYTDATLVTALDPATAAPTGDGAFTGIPTSSSTLPSLMARMLEDLDVADEHRVLEIGTGTGYNAALLSRRLGAKQVYSIDISRAVVDDARARLAEIGRSPHLASRDGRFGYPPGAPYDRIMATCSVPAIPPAWLEQTRPGGMILTDIATGIDGGLIRLTVSQDQHAEGTFTATTGRFMPARSAERTYDPTIRATPAPTLGTRDSPVRAADIRAHYPFRLLLGLRLPDLELVYHHDDTTDAMALQLQHPDGRWARSPLPGQPAEGTITWGGTTDLWSHVDDIWHWWTTHDRPGHTHFGITLHDGTTNTWWEPHDGGTRLPLNPDL
jgi:methyltransferase of ATP-grasp peptide maturase system